MANFRNIQTFVHPACAGPLKNQYKLVGDAKEYKSASNASLRLDGTTCRYLISDSIISFFLNLMNILKTMNQSSIH